MINKSIINGRVGKKPELKKTNGGKAWVRFSVATEENWKDKKTGEKKTRTDWHTIKVWGKMAEAICTHVVQGQMLEIIGPHRVDVVEKDGKTNYYEYIQAQEVVFGQKPKAWWDAFNAANGGAKPTQVPAAQPKVAESEVMKVAAVVLAALKGEAAALPAPPAGSPTHLVADEEDSEPFGGDEPAAQSQASQPPVATGVIDRL